MCRMFMLEGLSRGGGSSQFKICVTLDIKKGGYMRVGILVGAALPSAHFLSLSIQYYYTTTRSKIEKSFIQRPISTQNSSDHISQNKIKTFLAKNYFCSQVYPPDHSQRTKPYTEHHDNIRPNEPQRLVYRVETQIM